MHVFLGLFLVVCTASAIAQQYGTTSSAPALPDAPSYSARQPFSDAPTSETNIGTTVTPRSVSSATTLLSPLPKRYLNLSNPDVARTSALIFSGGSTADSTVSSSGKNCSSTSAGKNDASGWITSLVAMTSKGGHYCALGEGGFWKRGTYAAGRAFAAHRYDGGNSSNLSDAFGLGVAPGASYYSYQNYAGERLAARYASAIGRETIRNMFREFWPDIATHVRGRHP